MNVRHPAVAGTFYKSGKAELEKQIKDLFPRIAQRQGAENILGLVAPHAGYEYSGKTAALAYSCLPKDPKKNFIILGPNHGGTGPAVSIWRSGKWVTPLGEADINENMTAEIISNSAAEADESAHMREHSIEVHLPFLQFLFGKNFSFVPVCMRDQSLESAKNIADAVSQAKDATIIASSDFAHFESGESAERKDADAIKAIESLDVKRFYRTIEEKNISVCGFGPIAVLMIVARELGGKILLIRHSTSGDMTGDYDSVVGYAALKAVRG